jgi:hypothetical protein
MRRASYEGRGARAPQVISEYRKARALMADVAAQTKEGVWHNLFLEVEKVRRSVAACCAGCQLAPIFAWWLHHVAVADLMRRSLCVWRPA